MFDRVELTVLQNARKWYHKDHWLKHRCWFQLKASRLDFLRNSRFASIACRYNKYQRWQQPAWKKSLIFLNKKHRWFTCIIAHSLKAWRLSCSSMIVLHPTISGSEFIAIDYSQHSFETLSITQTGYCREIKSQILINLEQEIGFKVIFSRLLYAWRPTSLMSHSLMTHSNF